MHSKGNHGQNEKTRGWFYSWKDRVSQAAPGWQTRQAEWLSQRARGETQQLFPFTQKSKKKHQPVFQGDKAALVLGLVLKPKAASPRWESREAWASMPRLPHLNPIPVLSPGGKEQDSTVLPKWPHHLHRVQKDLHTGLYCNSGLSSNQYRNHRLEGGKKPPGAVRKLPVLVRPKQSWLHDGKLPARLRPWASPSHSLRRCGRNQRVSPLRVLAPQCQE